MPRHKLTAIVLGLLAVVLIAVGVVTIGSTAPGNFPEGMTFSVAKGATVSEIADKLFLNDAIRSTTLFKVYTTLLSKAGGVKTGNYFFGASESALRIAYRMVVGELGVLQVKVTVPEGLASPDIARAIKKDIPTFDDKGFLKLARPLEGYLFPDTYFFDRNTTPEDAITAMRDNFDGRTKSVRAPKTFGGKSYAFKDILTMASLVEEEATSSADRRIIAGILWKRIANGMALQVDAPFFYILGKTSAQLTLKDLATSSPYNLYKNKGLPPAPIDNPGLDAIIDTINPTDTKYWFFLSGTDGVTHFAADLAGHVKNMKYLK